MAGVAIRPLQRTVPKVRGNQPHWVATGGPLYDNRYKGSSKWKNNGVNIFLWVAVEARKHTLDLHVQTYTVDLICPFLDLPAMLAETSRRLSMCKNRGIR